MSQNESIVKSERIPVVDTGRFANLLDTARFEHLWRVARTFAASGVVPDMYRGKPENCFIALQMAIGVKVDPFLFMQNSYLIGNKVAIETKLALAMLLQSGRIVGTIAYQLTGSGQSLACTASCVVKDTGETVQHTLHWKTVVDCGWANKDGWKKDPTNMLQYRAAMRLIRTHFPDVLLGCLTREEAEEMSVITARSVSKPRPSSVINERIALPSVEQLALPVEADHGDAWEPDADEVARINETEAQS